MTMYPNELEVCDACFSVGIGNDEVDYSQYRTWTEFDVKDYRYADVGPVSATRPCDACGMWIPADPGTRYVWQLITPEPPIHLTVNVNLGNAAFEDSDKLSSLLHWVAYHISVGHLSGTLVDSNGLAVGTWSLS